MKFLLGGGLKVCFSFVFEVMVGSLFFKVLPLNFEAREVEVIWKALLYEQLIFYKTSLAV